MKQLLILSGKGGTGKTTVAGTFIDLAAAKAYADCDVDAPNLHLVMAQTTVPVCSDYYGMPKAEIDPEKCTACGQCQIHCRFSAISSEAGFRVSPFACEGCGVCVAVCPAAAVSLQPAPAGKLTLYQNPSQTFSTAQLKMGSGTSGKLVSEVKRQLQTALPPNVDLIIIDGSPGIGCPVIASMAAVDMVLLVAEPSLSGISDMTRILKTARLFQLKTAVCINKHDTSPINTASIEQFCQTNDLPLVGKIPFDPAVVNAVNQGKTLADSNSPAGAALKEVFRNTLQFLFENTHNKEAGA